MASTIENLLSLLYEDIEEQDDLTLVILTYTKQPKAIFKREHYPLVRKEAQEELFEDIESTYAEQLNGKDLIDLKIIVNPRESLTIKYIFK